MIDFDAGGKHTALEEENSDLDETDTEDVHDDENDYIIYEAEHISTNNDTDETVQSSTREAEALADDDIHDNVQVSTKEDSLQLTFQYWLKGVPYLSTEKTAKQHSYQSFKIWKYMTDNLKVEDY